MIYRNRFYRLQTVKIISTSYKDMMGMSGIESVEIIKYEILTDTIGCSYASDPLSRTRIYDLTSEIFHETYVTLQDDRNEKLEKLGI